MHRRKVKTAHADFWQVWTKSSPCRRTICLLSYLPTSPSKRGRFLIFCRYFLLISPNICERKYLKISFPWKGCWSKFSNMFWDSESLINPTYQISIRMSICNASSKDLHLTLQPSISCDFYFSSAEISNIIKMESWNIGLMENNMTCRFLAKFN